MTASTHLAVGAAVGVVAQEFLAFGESKPENFFWAFVAGFVSHLVLDAFTHQEYSFGGTKLGFVLFFEVTAMLVLLLSPGRSLMVNAVIFFGMVGGALPDVIELAHRYVINWPWLDVLGSKIHFCHGLVSFGSMASFQLQFFIALIAVLFVRLRPVL
ncbi:MAG TPA: hypothetical protein VJC06_01710 [Candidatus Paceibacterota bacterium]